MQPIVILLAVAVAAILIFLLANSFRKNKKSKKHSSSKMTSPPPAASSPPAPQPGLKPADDTSFNQMVSSFPGTTIAFFYAPWCGYCKKAGPKIEELANKLDAQRFQFLAINCDEAKEIGKRYAASFPTMVKFNSQGQAGGKLVGDHPTEKIMAFVGV